MNVEDEMAKLEIEVRDILLEKFEDFKRKTGYSIYDIDGIFVDITAIAEEHKNYRLNSICLNVEEFDNYERSKL